MAAVSLKRIIFIFCLLSFFCCSLWSSEKNELAKLRMENRRLRLELDRLRGKLSEKENDLLKFRHWLAASSDAGSCSAEDLCGPGAPEGRSGGCAPLSGT